MLEQFSNIISLATIIGLVSTFIARIIPNEKIYSFGMKFGQFLNGFGSTKIGSVSWEKIEDFSINSIGEFLRGFKDGLDK